MEGSIAIYEEMKKQTQFLAGIYERLEKMVELLEDTELEDEDEEIEGQQGQGMRGQEELPVVKEPIPPHPDDVDRIQI